MRSPFYSKNIVQIVYLHQSLGARLPTRKIESQEHERVIIANLVNLWNLFGRTACVKNG
ncbi:hypothetical protein OKW29_000114 [Paraburkholderia sp. CI3]